LADDGLRFVDYLAEWTSSVPMLLLGTARPELLSRRPGWGGGKSNALTISLSPLTDDQTANLVHALFDRSVLPAETQQALLERAGGNPLYAEEFVRLAQQGRIGTQMPESIQAIVAARLDGLSRDEKQLVQQAAVLGKVFWLGGLSSVADKTRASVGRDVPSSSVTHRRCERQTRLPTKRSLLSATHRREVA
jgi:predicted ATPase